MVMSCMKTNKKEGGVESANFINYRTLKFGLYSLDQPNQKKTLML